MQVADMDVVGETSEYVTGRSLTRVEWATLEF